MKTRTREGAVNRGRLESRDHKGPPKAGRDQKASPRALGGEHVPADPWLDSWCPEDGRRNFCCFKSPALW